MKSWEVRRQGKLLGHWIAPAVKLIGGTLYATFRGGRVIGAIAAGPGLTWSGIPILEAWKNLDRVTIRTSVPKI